MTLQLAYNTTDSALLADEQGYLVGGRSWGPVDTSDPVAKGELAAGRLVLADEAQVAASDRADAKAAVQALADRRSRLEQARAMDKSELAEALPDEVLAAMPVGGDGLPAKSELVEAVAAAPELDEPAQTTPKPRRGSQK